MHKALSSFPSTRGEKAGDGMKFLELKLEIQIIYLKLAL
jgi:hypothetical protein